jgi:hypothetical protein
MSARLSSALAALTDAELDDAIAAARQACLTAWSRWVAVRNAGATSLWCPEFQEHQALQLTVLSPLLVEHSRRDFERKLTWFDPPPLSGPDWDRAWFTGPGRDAQ